MLHTDTEAAVSALHMLTGTSLLGAGAVLVLGQAVGAILEPEQEAEAALGQAWEAVVILGLVLEAA